GFRLGFEPIDELLEDGLEPGIVVVGVVADDGDGLAVAVGGLAMIAAGFVDHAEAVIAVMDVGEAREQVVGGPFGGGGGLVTGHAALLVFLAAPAGAGIIPSDFGHLANVISKDGPSVPSRAGRRQVPRATSRLRPRPRGLRPGGTVPALRWRAAFRFV